MNICDFCSVTKLISSFIGESKNISQLDFMYNLFKDFIESKAGYDFDFDNGLVCRWLNGTAKISLGKAAKQSLKLMNDSTISERKKSELAEGYPYDIDTDISDFLSRIILFGMERPFVKRDAKTKAVMASGALSPIVQDYIYDGFVPKPCKHFCGRESELEQLHSTLENNSKIFIQGIAGIGKSEFVKKYAHIYKKEYTNILYFNYSGDLKLMRMMI